VTIHRKIYEQHFGSIPRDEQGRSLEIHHKDGNHANNDINNLQLVTVEEHYDIHHKQGDWAACLLIASQRLFMTFEERSELSRKAQNNLVQTGKHHFLNKEFQREMTRRSVEQRDKENFRDPVIRQKSKDVLDALKAKKQHPLQLYNSSKVEWKCEHCGKTGKGSANYQRWHGRKCKLNGSEEARTDTRIHQESRS
jgi:hypothetical protein